MTAIGCKENVENVPKIEVLCIVLASFQFVLPYSSIIEKNIMLKIMLYVI